MDKFIKKLHRCKTSGPPHPDMDQMVYNLRHSCEEALDDDFNVAPALASLFQFNREINLIMDQKGLSPIDKEKAFKALDRFNSVLGILDLEPQGVDEKVEALIQKRQKAREKKDWDEADRLRQELKEMGIEVIDAREGPIWHKIGE